MTRKIMFSMLFGAFVMGMAGLAAAEAPVLLFASSDGRTYLEMPTQQPGADTEAESSNTVPWLERGPVETGSMPDMPGDSPGLHCCGSPVDGEGNTVIRPGIDDGP
jgi:hypothetical protein